MFTIEFGTVLPPVEVVSDVLSSSSDMIIEITVRNLRHLLKQCHLNQNQ